MRIIVLMKPDEIAQAIQCGDIVVLGVIAALALALNNGWEQQRKA